MIRITKFAITLFFFLLSTGVRADSTRQFLYPPMTHPNLFMHHPDVSPDGRYVVLSAAEGGYNRNTIWVFDQQTGVGRPITQTTNDMSSGDVCARWSPDGKNVLFVSDREGATGIYVYSIVSNTLKKIHDTNIPMAWDAQSVWSPDGNKILYPDDLSGVGNLYLIDVATRAITKITDYKDSGDKIYFPSWSPSGRSIVYSIIGESKPNRLVQMDMEDNSTSEIHSGNAQYAYPRWNSDEKWLVYQNSRRIYILNIENGNQIEVPAPSGLRAWGPAWGSKKDELIFQAAESGGIVKVHNFENGLSWPLFETPTGIGYEYWASWSADNDHVAFFSISFGSPPDTSLVIATVSTQTLTERATSDEMKRRLIPPKWSQSRNGYVYSVATEMGSAVVFESWPDQIMEYIFNSERIVSKLAITNDEEIIAYVAHKKNEPDKQDIWFFDQISSAHYQVTFRNNKVDILNFSPDGEKVFFRSEKESFVLDTNTNILHELGDNFFWCGSKAAWRGNDRVIFEGARKGPPGALYEYSILERAAVLFHRHEGPNNHIFNPNIGSKNVENVYFTSHYSGASDLKKWILPLKLVQQF